MAKRQRDAAKEQFWRQAMARRERSRLSVRDFCEGEGFSEASYYRWRCKLARGDRASPPVAAETFVPVEVVTQAPAAIEIVLPDGVRVRVQPGFDRQTLGQVVALLTGGVSC
jgi:hypothetical protein